MQFIKLFNFMIKESTPKSTNNTNSNGVIVYIDAFNLYHSIRSTKKKDEMLYCNLPELFKKFLGKSGKLKKIHFFTSDPKGAKKTKERHKAYNEVLKDICGVEIHNGEFKGKEEVIPKSFLKNPPNFEAPNFKAPNFKTAEDEIISGYINCLKVFFEEHSVHGFEQTKDYEDSKDTKYYPYKEKQTDVNLALQVAYDLIKGAHKKVIIVSNDSDFIPLLKYSKDIREGRTDIEVHFMIPPGEVVNKDIKAAIEKHYDKAIEKHYDKDKSEYYIYKMDEDMFINNQLPSVIKKNEKKHINLYKVDKIYEDFTKIYEDFIKMFKDENNTDKDVTKIRNIDKVNKDMLKKYKNADIIFETDGKLYINPNKDINKIYKDINEIYRFVEKRKKSKETNETK